MYSVIFSDWLSTIDEIVKFAWNIWLTEIAITDHSQAVMDFLIKKNNFFPNWARYSIKK